MDARVAAFTTEATQRFAFLAESLGFSGPDTSEPGYVGYASPPWQIWVVLEEQDKTVDTFVSYDDGDVVLRAPLRRLAAESKIDGLEQPSISAQTLKGMQKSLSNQAATARVLHDVFADMERGRALMHRAVQ